MKTNSQSQSGWDTAKAAFQDLNWRHFYLLGGSFRILEILIFFNGILLANGHGYSMLAIGLALVCVSLLTLLTTIVIQYMDRKEDEGLVRDQGKLEKTLAQMDHTANLTTSTAEITPARHKWRMRIYTFMTGTVVFSAGATIYSTLKRWLSGTHIPPLSSHVLMIFNVALIATLLVCIYKKHRYNQGVAHIRNKNAKTLTHTRELAKNLLALRPSHTQQPTSTAPGDDPLVTTVSTNQEVLEQIQNYEPKLGARRWFFYNVIIPGWNLLSTIFAVVFLLDFIAAPIFHTPSFMTLQSPLWLLAAEAVIALLITIPYIVERWRDGREDIALRLFPQEHRDLLNELATTANPDLGKQKTDPYANSNEFTSGAAPVPAPAPDEASVSPTSPIPAV